MKVVFSDQKVYAITLDYKIKFKLFAEVTVGKRHQDTFRSLSMVTLLKGIP